MGSQERAEQLRDLSESLLTETFTLESVPKQRIQLGIKLCLLLQHVEQELVLSCAVDLSLLESALHHLDLRLLLSSV